MSNRKILLLDHPAGPWSDFLREFLEETSAVLDCFQDAGHARNAFQRGEYDLIFFNPSFLSLAWSQALEAHRMTHPQFRVLAAGPSVSGQNFRFDAGFPEPPSMEDFQRQVLTCVVQPEKIRVLIVDDEPEIGAMVRDFLERRVHPSFEVTHAPDGRAGLDCLLAGLPDVLILDVKMPRMDGREVYREIRQRKLEVPTIIFFDAISGDEMTEIRKYGRPAVVEKGAPQSALPELMELVKKMAYFS